MPIYAFCVRLCCEHETMGPSFEHNGQIENHLRGFRALQALNCNRFFFCVGFSEILLCFLNIFLRASLRVFGFRGCSSAFSWLYAPEIGP